ncbi:polyprenyl synthetase family protein [Candidatus Sumerlaeota bacterium]|nr:polyprenyl synthetase family protein [Candidatus Sumerlaeota bacterium]
MPLHSLSMRTDVPHLLAERAREVEAHLESVVPSAETTPTALHAAMRHSLFAGGKRLRPALVLESARAAGLDPPTPALPVAAALEMIHTYSLIHDDLPCMDDDDLRRGRPTCHVVHGEAMAILAGDALLTLAFTHLGEAAQRGLIPAAALPRIVTTLGRCAGTPGGMVAGQVLDIEGEGKELDASAVDAIHRHKTGALIEASCVCGGLVAEPPEGIVKALSQYGRALGLAFQIVDDILDATSTCVALGKTAGKDIAQGKATYVSVHGLEAARAEAKHQAEQARGALASLGERGEPLASLVDFVIQRQR